MISNNGGRNRVKNELQIAPISEITRSMKGIASAIATETEIQKYLF